MFYENGMWKDAEYLNHQIVEIGMKKLGKKHPSTLTSMENLAVTYAHQGKYEQAEELMLNVLDLSSDANTLPSLPMAWLGHLGQWKWLWAALSSPGLAKPIENAQCHELTILVVFMGYLHLLTIK